MGVDTIVGIGEYRNNGYRGKSCDYADMEIGTRSTDAPDFIPDSARKKGRFIVRYERLPIEQPRKLSKTGFDLLGMVQGSAYVPATVDGALEQTSLRGESRIGVEEVRFGKIVSTMAIRQKVRGNGKVSMLAGTT